MSELIINDKYFNLDIDPRFPQKIPEGEWQPLGSKRLISPKNLSVYLLKAKNRFYVGTDINGSRPFDHRSGFARKDHGNDYMQNVYNKYGIEVFYYRTLIIIPQEYKQYRNEIENSYIKLFNTYIDGYNIVEFAGTTLGYKHTEKTKKKLSKKAKQRESNPFKGKKHSEKTKSIISANNSKPVKCLDTNKVYKSMKEAADEYHVTSTTILRAVRGMAITAAKKRWAYADEFLASQFKPKVKKEMIIKKYYLWNPEGKLKEISNVANFCKENYLTETNVRKVLKGTQKHCKGWRKPYILEDISQETIKQMEVEDRKTNSQLARNGKNLKERWFYFNKEIVKINDLPFFCKERGLNAVSMSLVYLQRKHYLQHKGYSSARQEQLAQNPIPTPSPSV